MSIGVQDKIIVVHTIPMGAGGISNLTLTINEKIDRNRFSFRYLVFRDQHEFCDERAKALGSDKIIVDLSHERNQIVKVIKKVFITARILKKENIKILHIDASTPYDMILAIAGKLASVKSIIIHSHSDNFEKKNNTRNFLMPIFKKLIPFFVTDYMAISEQAAKFMFSKKIIKSNKYVIMKNGIDINKYIYNETIRKVYRKRYKLEEKFVVGHVGRFVHAKNQEFLVDVFYELLKEKQNAVLLMVGIGERQDLIKSYVKKLDIEDKVIFWGISDDVPNIMQAMDFFVFPSRYEGLGMAVIEAQAAGLPVLCSNVLPKEVEITKNIKKINLDCSCHEWASLIIDLYNKVKRCDMNMIIKEAGYDINETVKKLEELYLYLHKEERF